MDAKTKKEAVGYDLGALKQLQIKRQANIAVFEQAISDERTSMAREAQMIAYLEAKAEVGS